MQSTIKRILLVVLTIATYASGTMVTYAQTSSEALRNAQQQLQEKQQIVNQQKQEQQAVNQEIQGIQKELDSIYAYITKNQEEMAQTQAKIDEVNQLIEQKKEEIVALEDKILGRSEIMKKRAVAMQQSDNFNIIMNVFLESESISDFIKRASAVSTLMDADKDILNSQKADLQKIEDDKKEIDKQEQVLLEQQNVLATKQAELDQNLQKRQEVLTAMQDKYNQITQQLALAEQDKAKIQSQMAGIQAAIAQQQASARPAPAQDTSSAGISGKEMYVTATAYSHEDSGSVTAMGYNIEANPNMKLIAVDPSVIPLGSRVWVEGYGEAIAGDTGGAIKGHRIDILKPNSAEARAWGRRTVKLIILN